MKNGQFDNGCTGAYIGLALTCIALVISVSLNILLYSLRRKERKSNGILHNDVEEPIYRESFSAGRLEECRLSQENPIYGNICMDGGGTLRRVDYGCYEPMTSQSTRQDETAEPPDVSYASLDLSVGQKRKKKRKYQQKQSQSHQVQTHPPLAQQSCLEADADGEVALPSRSSSLMMSRNSIYLNSHQMALETEQLDRQRERQRERKSNHEREIELRNMQDDFDRSHGKSEPMHGQDS